MKWRFPKFQTQAKMQFSWQTLVLPPFFKVFFAAFFFSSWDSVAIVFVFGRMYSGKFTPWGRWGTPPAWAWVSSRTRGRSRAASTSPRPTPSSPSWQRGPGPWTWAEPPGSRWWPPTLWSAKSKQGKKMSDMAFITQWCRLKHSLLSAQKSGCLVIPKLGVGK